MTNLFNTWAIQTDTEKPLSDTTNRLTGREVASIIDTMIEAKNGNVYVHINGRFVSATEMKESAARNRNKVANVNIVEYKFAAHINFI